MNDRLASYQDIFLDLYREMVLPVYRFHLVRSGDWHQAQTMTAATFLEALRWFDPHLRGSHRERIWLFGIAAAMEMRRVKDVFSFSAGDSSIVPSQEQMAQFVKVTEVYEKWRLLPRKQADAQAFSLFSALELNEIAEVVGWDISDVMEKIASEVSSHNELRILAKAIEPVGYFSRWLENEIRELSSGRNGPDRIRIGLRLLLASYHNGPFLNFLGRVVPVLLFIGLLIWGIWAVTHQDLQGEPPGIRAPTAPRITFTPNVLHFTPSHDSLVLADQDGRIFLQSLVDDKITYLSGEGFYKEGLMDPAIPPTISPDGNWFSIAWLGNLGTWLLSLDGKEAIKVIARPVKLAWSPDGKQVAFGDPTNPSRILVYRINNHVAQPVATAIGKISSLAWSPDGEKIGVVSYTKRTGMDQHLGGDREYIQLNIGIYYMTAQEFRVIKSFDDAPIDPGSTAVDLMWTSDGKELWLPIFREAFSIADLGEHELLGQPFLDNYGVQSALLGNFPGNSWQNQALLSPDQKYLAVVNNMSNGSPGTVYIHPVSEIYQREWVDNFPNLKSYGEIAWTEEGKNLIFSEKVSGPGKVLRIDAATGQWDEIAQYVQFFGTRSSLMQAGNNRAPQVRLIRSSRSDPAVQPWSDVSDPGTGIHLRLPADWHMWSYTSNQTSVLAAANFDFANPWGFASLYDQDVLIWIASTPRQNNHPIKTQLEDIARGYEPGSYTFKPLHIEGVEAYLSTVELPDHTRYNSAWIATQTSDIHISTTQSAHEWDATLDRIVQSIHFDDAVKLPLLSPATPTPQGKSIANQTGWREFKSSLLGIKFEAPAAYPQTDGKACSVYEDGDAIHLGSRIWMTVVDPGGKSLADYANSVTFNNTSQWTLVTQDALKISGDPAVMKTYDYWGEEIMKATFILHKNKIYALNYSAEGTCNFLDQGVTEEKAYQHLLDTLKFSN